MPFDQLKRRDFITLLGSAAARPLAARAQQRDGMRRIGMLVSLAADDPVSLARVGAFLQGLQELGWAVPQQRNRVQTKSGALRAIPLLSTLIFITTAAIEKRTMSVRMAVANERAIFVLVNIAASLWFGCQCTDCASVFH
jgi:putative ABC transport system substrate-binding protein